jgi:FKBP-type peptidyl-prolyl cis-trans isomerase SlyD
VRRQRANARRDRGKLQEDFMHSAIEHGTTVQIEYTLRDDAGTVLDSNTGGEPLTYVQGQHQIIPGLEDHLLGLRAGDETHVTVAPEQAYGVVDPKALTVVPREALPAEALVEGTELRAKRRDGGTQYVTVKEVRDSGVVIDLNHPLAGKTLHVDVRIVDVTPPATGE